MASKRKPKAPEAPIVATVPLPGGQELSLRAPGVEEIDRFLDKQARDQVQIGRRELIACCIVGIDSDEKRAILARFPALIVPLSDTLADLSAGDFDMEADISTGAISVTGEGFGFTFSAPDIDQWEATQAEFGKRGVRYGEAARRFLIGLSPEAGDLLAKFPGAIGQLYSTVERAAGGGLEIVVKKG